MYDYKVSLVIQYTLIEHIYIHSSEIRGLCFDEINVTVKTKIYHILGIEHKSQYVIFFSFIIHATFSKRNNN